MVDVTNYIINIDILLYMAVKQFMINFLVSQQQDM